MAATDFLTEICQKIDEKTDWVFNTTGQTLFAGAFKEKPDICIVVNLVQPAVNMSKFGVVQVVLDSRAVNRSDSSENLLNLLSDLSGWQEDLLNGRILWSNIMQGPQLVMIDSENRHYFQGILALKFVYFP